MDSYWYLQTHGDPLSKVRDFIKHIWQASSLDGLMVTMNGIHALPRYVTHVADINQVNPFRPLMEINAARLIPALLAEHPDARVGVLLRPCELRALIEMSKHTPIDLDRLLTMSVDCLGTLPADEYQWRLERLEHGRPSWKTSAQIIPDDLATEAINFARQGGIVPYRYRNACQVCPSPAAQNADINIHVLGLPVRRHMLASFSHAATADSIHINDYANGSADRLSVQQHERILARMSERHARSMERVSESLGSLLPTGVDALIRQLESCGSCQRCLEVCPICSVDRPPRDEHGHYDRRSVIRWLVSCAGCGMCEQSCSKTLPTAAIFAHIRQQLDQQWDYIPGRSTDEPLPIL